MRTTLTLDEDVSIRLERLRKKRDLSFREVVNDTLRQGFARLEAPSEKPQPVETIVVDLGAMRVGDLKDALSRMDEEHDRKNLGVR